MAKILKKKFAPLAGSVLKERRGECKMSGREPFKPLWGGQCDLGESELHFSLYLHFYGEIPSVYTHLLHVPVGASMKVQKGVQEWCKNQKLTLFARGTYSRAEEDEGTKALLLQLDIEYEGNLSGELWRDPNNPLLISTDFNRIILYHRVAHPRAAEIVKDLVEKFPSRKKKKTKTQINFLVHQAGQFNLRQVHLPDAKIEIGLNYGKSFVPIDAKIKLNLLRDQPGLILLHGDPGTGKTFYIRYLLNVLREAHRLVIYVPPFVAKSIAQPEFLPFMLAQDRPILVVEDAEQVLVARDTDAESAVANVLNLTDGILAEALRCQLLATFNVSKAKIDQALLRKGRLMVDHHFMPLSVEEANAKLKELGIDDTVTEPTTLADLYNFGYETGHRNSKKGPVGFRK